MGADATRHPFGSGNYDLNNRISAFEGLKFMFTLIAQPLLALRAGA